MRKHNLMFYKNMFDELQNEMKENPKKHPGKYTKNQNLYFIKIR